MDFLDALFTPSASECRNNLLEFEESHKHAHVQLYAGFHDFFCEDMKTSSFLIGFGSCTIAPYLPSLHLLDLEYLLA
jgi:hypothetical protein